MEEEKNELTLAAIDAMSPEQIGELLGHTRDNLATLQAMNTALMTEDEQLNHALLVARAMRLITFFEVVEAYQDAHQNGQEGTDEQH